MISLIMNIFTKVFEKSLNPMPNHCVECDKPTMETLCPECMDKEESEDPENNLISNCCFAPFGYPGWPDDDTCSKCGEHADTAISEKIFIKGGV